MKVGEERGGKSACTKREVSNEEMTRNKIKEMKRREE